MLLSVESFPAGAESRFRDAIPLKAMKIMVRPPAPVTAVGAVPVRHGRVTKFADR